MSRGRITNSTTFKPTAGMKSAARSAINRRNQLKKRGIKNLPTTRVGLERANQIIRGEAMSFSTVKRMFSFFSRHERVFKSTGRKDRFSGSSISWGMWGGNAGFSWSRKIVNRAKNQKKKTVTVRKKSSPKRVSRVSR